MKAEPQPLPAEPRTRRLRLGVLTNPNAGGQRVATRLSPAGMFEERITQSATEVGSALDALGDVDAIVVNGGDGTLGGVVSHCIATGRPIPKILPVLGGSNNAVARDVGGRHTFAELAAIEARSLTAAAQRRTLVVRDGNGALLGAGFIFSTGLIVRFTEAYYARGLLGPAGAALVTFEKLGKALLPLAGNRTFWAFENNRFAIGHHGGRKEDVAWDGGAQLSFASTVDTQILFFRPFKKTARQLVEEGGFNLLLNGMRPLQILPRLWPIARGRYDGHGHSLAHAETVRVTGSDRFFLDGEIVRTNSAIEISAGPVVSFVSLA